MVLHFTELCAHWISIDLLSAIAIVRTGFNRVFLVLTEQTTSSDSQRSFNERMNTVAATPLFYKNIAFPVEDKYSYFLPILG